MTTPYVGEIRMFAGTFAPQGWEFCNGQLLSIADNAVLFDLLGTTYGGDGKATFALPDLRGRFPIHQGNGPGLTPRTIGEIGGVESVTLTTAQLPPHTHVPMSAAAGTQASPANGVWAGAPAAGKFYSNAAPNANMAAAVAPTGGNQPHDNMKPFLAVNFIMSLFGVFPSQN